MMVGVLKGFFYEIEGHTAKNFSGTYMITINQSSDLALNLKVVKVCDVSF